MPVKKQPSPAQLAARKKFAAMAKSGELMKKRKAAAPKKKTNVLNWKSHPDGYDIAKYKMGSISKQNGKYQINYFGTIGQVSKNATSLADAKKKLDLISLKKTGLKKPVAKKVVATKKTTKCSTPTDANLKLRKLAYNACGRLRPGWKALKCGTLKFIGTTKKTVKKGLNGLGQPMSLSAYKKAIHKVYDRIKVVSKSGKIYEIYKTEGTTYSGNKSKIEGSLFSVKENGLEVTKKTKLGIINYLLKK